MCYTPELATEVTLQPVRRYGLDAAILFSDILVVPHALGCRVRFEDGAGPKLEPVRDAAAIEQLRPALDLDHLAPVYAAIRQVREILPAETALIGFAGAPWTLAAYMVEGRQPRNFLPRARSRWHEPDAFARLIELLSEAVCEHLAAQIDAGAEVVQLFDSWAGVLPEPEFVRWCAAPAARIVGSAQGAQPEVPIIAFPRGAGVMYQRFAMTVPVDAVGLDSSVPLAWAREAMPGVCLQGNLDPAALVAGGEVACREAARIVETLGERRSCSTWATACCRRPIPLPWARWSST